MKRIFTLFMLGIGFVVCSYAQVLDQKNDNLSNKVTSYGVTNSGFAFVFIGQGFKSGITGNLTSIDVFIEYYISGSEFSAKIYEGTGLAGNVLASQSFVVNSSNVGNFISIQFDTPASVTADNFYTLEISSNAGSQIELGATNNWYTSGLIHSKDNTSTRTLNQDILFRTYVEEILCPATSSLTDSTSCTPVTWNGQTYTTSGNYSKTGLTNADGCDSTANLNLTILSPTSSTLDITQCGNYTTTSGKILSINGTYKDTIPNAVGCDSIITINFVNKAPEIKSATVDQLVCNNSAANITIENTDEGVTYKVYQNNIDGYVREFLGTGANVTVQSNTITANDIIRLSAWQEENHALKLGGANDYVVFNEVPYQYSNALTVESDVYFDGINQPWAGQTTFNVDAQATNVWLWHAGIFYVNDNGTWRAINFPDVETPGWKHVTTVANSTGLFIYYDGIEVASNTQGVSNIVVNNNSSVVIGQDPRFVSEMTRNSNISLDNFSIWNVAKTAQEVSNYSSNCLSGSESGLVFYSNFNNVVSGSNTFIANKGGIATIVNAQTDDIIDGTSNCVNTCVSYFGVDYNVTVSAVIDSSFSVVAFKSYDFDGTSLEVTGDYSAVFESAAGCDSTVYLDLIITFIAGDLDGSEVLEPGEIAGDVNFNGIIDGNEICGDVNGNFVIDFEEVGSGSRPTENTNEIAGDVNGNGIIDGDEIAGDKNGNGFIEVGEKDGDANNNDTIGDCSDKRLLEQDLPNTELTLVGAILTSSETKEDASFTWYDCSMIDAIEGEVLSELEAPYSGGFKVAVTLDNCTLLSPCKEVLATGLKALNSNQQINIYPNPTNGIFVLELEYSSKAVITNALGLMVSEVELSSGTNLLNLENHQEGVYFIRVDNQVTKLVIKK